MVINSFEDLKRLEGEHIGTSEFMVITQECIDTFARATYDNQWIHTDMERAKAEIHFQMEIGGEKRHAMEGVVTFLYYLK